MRVILWILSAFNICVIKSTILSRCHYDPDQTPKDGILPKNLFTWMALLEYVNEYTGARYDARLPRVQIIHARYGLTLASAVAVRPRHNSLGNVVLVEYVMDEVTCGMSMKEWMSGKQCPEGSYSLAIDDVIVHPEYMNFEAPESLALLKLIKPIESIYMMPICLPNEPVWLYEWQARRVHLLDFLSVAPQDYETERKAIKRIHLLSKSLCEEYQRSQNISTLWRERSLCTTGCGMREGSALVSHDQHSRIGFYWHLVGVAVGKSYCDNRVARNRRNVSPPRYIYVWPYVDWITQVVLSHEIPYPLPLQAYADSLLLSNTKDKSKDTAEDFTPPLSGKWEGRYFIAGHGCELLRKGPKYRPNLFYEDYFCITSEKMVFLNYSLKVIPEQREYEIQCVKFLMPNVMTSPEVHINPLVPGENKHLATVKLRVTCPKRYDLRIQMWGTLRETAATSRRMGPLEVFEEMGETQNWHEEDLEQPGSHAQTRNESSLPLEIIRTS